MKKKDVIIACDFPSWVITKEFLELFRDKKPFVKIGMELFYSEGPQAVREIKDRGHRVFLDLKLHDIPNTVEKAMRRLSALGIDMCNVHAAGTTEMMRAAMRGLTAEGGARPLLIAVTQLTSTDENKLHSELLIDKSMNETVLHYAKNAASAGLDGVVCSPLEAAGVKELCGKGFLTVTPGIRFEENSSDDQKRVATPARSRETGTDFIVMGRPIIEAADPVRAYERAVRDFLGED
ncbi:MAG: orotidine-5'-phosphate decarboxylase [Eubacteriales bacterium]|nr:orotidine-5'-phosphate decarboxylase [Eubacteriales bacterium]MDD4421584.1 orotidine-5'-phosphate decarboxylase [Eubacteriales bacterium]